jgi:integrase
MDWRDVPTFYTDLGGHTVELALKLLILTGLRSAPVRFARPDQIRGAVWIVPAENMKSLKGKADDFHVPLSEQALSVIVQAKQGANDGYLFPGMRKGVISDMSMAAVMKRRQLGAKD